MIFVLTLDTAKWVLAWRQKQGSKTPSHVCCILQIELPRSDLYLPTNPSSRVIAAIPESATPMQSAAKVPILVAFKVCTAIGCNTTFCEGFLPSTLNIVVRVGLLAGASIQEYHFAERGQR